MRHALLELRQHPTRLIAVVLSVMISVGFLVSCLTFVATESQAIRHSLTASTANSDVVVRPNADPHGRLRAAIAAVPGVASVEPTYDAFTEFIGAAGDGQLMLSTRPVNPRLQWATLSEGTWPTGPTQLAVSRTTARQQHLAVGDTLTFTGRTDSSNPSSPTQQLMTVSGITDQSRSLFSGLTDSALVDLSYLSPTERTQYTPTYLVLGDPSTTPAALAVTVAAVLPADSDVKTSVAVSDEALASMTDGVDVFRYLLLGFGAVALLVGAIIIANTFTVVLAQRRRQIGLLRAVGASGSQVRRQVLSESLVVGAVGAAGGVGLGTGIAAIATTVTGSITTGFVVPVPTVLLAAAVGLVVTVLAALLPAGRAMRVPPLEALRPVQDGLAEKRTGRRRLVVALLLVAAGAGVVGLALYQRDYAFVGAIAGSALLAVGILLATPAFLPRALQGLGRLAGLGGSTGRLAAANTVRNPGRAAATCTALMLAVGLIVTLQVGAASMKSTVGATLDSEFPVDLTVTNPIGPLSPEVVAGVRAVSGVKATAPVSIVTAGVKGQRDTSLRVAGIGPDGGSVVAAGFEQLGDGIALAHHFTLENLGLTSGDPLTVTYHGRTATFVLEASDVADAGMVVVTADALAELAPDAPVSSLWVAATDRSLAGSIMADVRRVVAQQPGIELAGTLLDAAALDELLGTLLTVATALLAVAVVIALIGVGNTLGLSVIERSRESALLRALGLQRRQLRLMLAVEAILLAVVGAVVGIAAGALFGVIGTVAVVRQAGLSQLHFAVSVPQTLGVVALAIVAGAVASILPGRRAAQAAPTAALAEA